MAPALFYTMFKNVARVRDLFIAKNQRDTLIPTMQEIKQIDQKYFVKHRENLDPQHVDSKIIEELETFVVENKFILSSQYDFGLGIDELRMIHAIYQGLLDELQVDQADQKPLDFYLTRIRMFQLETEIELARVQNDEQREKEHVRQEFMMRKIEEAEASFKKDLVEKSNQVADLARKVADLETQNAKAKEQLGKLVSSKIEDKAKLSSLEVEKCGIERELQNARQQKANLENELQHMNQNAVVFNQTLQQEKQKFTKEIDRIRSDLAESTKQQQQKQNEMERLRTVTRDLEHKNRELVESNPQGNDSNMPLFIISIDINNMERSLNKNDIGLRLFNIKELFTNIYNILVQSSKGIDVYNIIGHAFYSAQNAKFKAEAENIEGNLATFISMFEWHKTRLKDGYIPGTTKKKNQDVDTLLVAKTIESIVKHSSSVHSIYLASGDMHMMPILDCAKENKIPVHVIGKRESMSLDIVKEATKTHYL